MASKCPECGSSDFVDTTRVEHCNACGYDVYYGDAHATGDAQISKINGIPCGEITERCEKAVKIDEKSKIVVDFKGFPLEEDLHAIARQLFIKLDMVRAADCDYEVTIQLLRDVFNAGRSRGAYEMELS